VSLLISVIIFSSTVLVIISMRLLSGNLECFICTRILVSTPLKPLLIINPTLRPQTPAYTLFATHTASPDAISRGKAPDFTGILLTLIRLETQQTDLVISINVPHVDGEYNKNDVDPSAGKQGPALDAATSFRDRILQTFEIRDWDLFVQE
jgi:hypothetical protein